MDKKQTMLIILDGFGNGTDYNGNAITNSDIPFYHSLLKESPSTQLDASGESVGLPEGQMGNSEVGHMNIGSGRIIYQELTRINRDIKEETFFKKKKIKEAIENCKINGSKLHLMGLVSYGGVHSHMDHLIAILEYAKKESFYNVYIHCFLDGRDVAPKSGKNDIENLIKKMKELKIGKIATISGRYYSMDRDNRWDRVELAYNAIVLGTGNKEENSVETIEKNYKEGITDEFIKPTVMLENESPVALIEKDDSVIFFNFRPDRARELTRAIVDKDFQGFNRKKEVKTYFLCMTQYDKTIENVNIIYSPEKYSNTLGEYLSKHNLNQLRIAETEKYAHVTFFFNGGVEYENPGEDRILIDSPKVATYDLKPEMSAIQLTEAVLAEIEKEKYDLIIMNFANPDMVGHTGDIKATIKALEIVDICLERIVRKLDEKKGQCIITSDHGNAEEMINQKNGEKVTSHTTNKVPLIFVGEKSLNLREGILADIAPTLLDIMGLSKPKEMTGYSLIKK